ncbi:triose-phosphate isomerase [Malassezia pachydermatis]
MPAPLVGALPPRRRLVGVLLATQLDYVGTQHYVREVLREYSAHPDSPFLEAEGTQAMDLLVIPSDVSIVPLQEHTQAASVAILVGTHSVPSDIVSLRTLFQAGCRVMDFGRVQRRCGAETIITDVAVLGMIPLLRFGETVCTESAAQAASECWSTLEALYTRLPESSHIILVYEPGRSGVNPSWMLSVVQAVRRQCLAAQPARNDASLIILYKGPVQPGVYEHLYDGIDGILVEADTCTPQAFMQLAVEVYQAGRTTAQLR